MERTGLLARTSQFLVRAVTVDTASVRAGAIQQCGHDLIYHLFTGAVLRDLERRYLNVYQFVDDRAFHIQLEIAAPLRL